MARIFLILGEEKERDLFPFVMCFFLLSPHSATAYHFQVDNNQAAVLKPIRIIVTSFSGVFACVRPRILCFVCHN